MLCEIFKKLHLKDVLAASVVCKKWRRIAGDIIADKANFSLWCDDSHISLLNSSINYKNFIFYVSFMHDEYVNIIYYPSLHG